MRRAARPKHPHELAHHSCIVRTGERGTPSWPYRVDGRVDPVAIAAPLRTNNANAAYRAAAEGIGIATALIDRSGSCWRAAPSKPSSPSSSLRRSVHAIWRSSFQAPAKTRLFVEHLAAYLKAQQL